MRLDIDQFVQDWVEHWNQRDLDGLLVHYADDFVIESPLIRSTAGIDQDKLQGKVEIRRYWERALSNLPEFEFKVIEVLVGAESIAIYYDAVLGKRAIEVMRFNEAGKVSSVLVHYTA